VETTDDFPELLDALASGQSVREPDDAPASLFDTPAPAALEPAAAEPAERPDIYELVWPRIAEVIVEGRPEKEIAAALGLELGQLRKWLKRAVEQGRATRLARPARVQLAQGSGTQLQLLEGPAARGAPAKKRSRGAKPSRADGTRAGADHRRSSAA
jgi:hypothetical protein